MILVQPQRTVTINTNKEDSLETIRSTWSTNFKDDEASIELAQLKEGKAQAF